MLRFVSLFLAVGILLAVAQPTKLEVIEFDVDELAEIPCENRPWVDRAVFQLSASGYDNPACDYYMGVDLREKIDDYCKKRPGACSFRLDSVLGKKPDEQCVSSYEVKFMCYY